MNIYRTNFDIGHHLRQNGAVLQVPAYLYCGPLPSPFHRLLLVLGTNRYHVLLRQTVIVAMFT